jgi:hypothetical protein
MKRSLLALTILAAVCPNARPDEPPVTFKPAAVATRPARPATDPRAEDADAYDELLAVVTSTDDPDTLLAALAALRGLERRAAGRACDGEAHPSRGLAAVVKAAERAGLLKGLAAGQETAAQRAVLDYLEFRTGGRDQGGASAGHLLDAPHPTPASESRPAKATERLPDRLLRELQHPPATSGIRQAITTWQPQLVSVPDPTHAGAPVPGFAGRLYLFGEGIDFPKVGDGSVVVDLYDESAARPRAVLLETWHLDQDSLERLLRKDIVGWGYTLFLPWGTARPEVNRVRLDLRYEPGKGPALNAEGKPFTIDPPPKGAPAWTNSADPSPS